VDQAEQPLPFAWMTPVNGSRAYAVAPDTGEYTWFDGGEERASIIVQAPGYYSRAAIVDLGDAEGAEVFALTPRPGTTLLSWGEGQLTLPDDSDVVQGEGTIALNRGWIWGSGGGTESVAVQVGAYMVEIASGSFAIEYRPAQRGWFY